MVLRHASASKNVKGEPRPCYVVLGDHSHLLGAPSAVLKVLDLNGDEDLISVELCVDVIQLLSMKSVGTKILRAQNRQFVLIWV